jgi:hypothetical protein
MKRHDDWEALLDKHFAETQTCAQRWGVDDCAIRACNAVLAITGVDLAADFRGTYSTELGAARAIKKFCGGGLEQLAEKIAQQYGIDEAPVFCARRGDVVLTRGDQPALGIVALDGWTVKTTAEGYTLENCKRAWRIG